jgi:hypothetical protein
MQWGMVFHEGEHAGIMKHVRDEYAMKQARALAAKRQQKSRKGEMHDVVFCGCQCVIGNDLVCIIAQSS